MIILFSQNRSNEFIYEVEANYSNDKQNLNALGVLVGLIPDL